MRAAELLYKRFVQSKNLLRPSPRCLLEGSMGPSHYRLEIRFAGITRPSEKEFSNLNS
jgi:hypothetical protein